MIGINFGTNFTANFSATDHTVHHSNLIAEHENVSKNMVLHDVMLNIYV